MVGDTTRKSHCGSLRSGTLGFERLGPDPKQDTQGGGVGVRIGVGVGVRSKSKRSKFAAWGGGLIRFLPVSDHVSPALCAWSGSHQSLPRGGIPPIAQAVQGVNVEKLVEKSFFGISSKILRGPFGLSWEN